MRFARVDLPIVIPLGLVLGALLFGQEVVAAEDGGLVRVAIGDVALLRQGPTEGCGPTSLINQLRLGPPAWRRVAATFAAADDRQCLDALVARYCTADGRGDTIRYSHDHGIADPQLTRLWQRLAADHGLTPPQTLYTTRLADESDADFIARINRALCASLTRGIPTIMSIDSYGQREHAWQKLTGHYLLITGAQRLGRSNTSNFLIEYVDPVEARRGQMLVYVVRRPHAGAYAHLPEGDRWLTGSPYLGLCSPDTALRQQTVPPDVRHECFLTLLVGDSTN